MNKRNTEFMMSSCQKENAIGQSEGRILLHSKTEYKRLIENISILMDENEEYYFILHSSFFIFYFIKTFLPLMMLIPFVGRVWRVPSME